MRGKLELAVGLNNLLAPRVLVDESLSVSLARSSRSKLAQRPLSGLDYINHSPEEREPNAYHIIISADIGSRVDSIGGMVKLIPDG